MKLADREIITALSKGKRINRGGLNFFVHNGLIMKETNDGRTPVRRCSADFYLSDLIADDWRIVGGSK